VLAHSRVLEGTPRRWRAVSSSGLLVGYSRVLTRCRSGTGVECAAAAARPRAARAVLSCAGAYLSGVAGSNACPAGSVRIETEAACRTAVTAAGMTPYSNFVVSYPMSPRGCYHYANANNAYFNTHAVGAGNVVYQLLCAAVTTGAPFMRGCARALVHLRVQ
jgi:hypothetical protein